MQYDLFKTELALGLKGLFIVFRIDDTVNVCRIVHSLVDCKALKELITTWHVVSIRICHRGGMN